ncbi:pentapeptide repeat-containing protein [Allorhodopirellula heiligendammensis]|uniref:pentapeptide repeat-containing protein n=1 Tax=Allorhodopirellula heiligendammensis TaxID=2714739 RepID=UPI00345E5CC6
MHGARLYGARLYGARLYGARLYGAQLHGAQLHVVAVASTVEQRDCSSSRRIRASPRGSSRRNRNR